MCHKDQDKELAQIALIAAVASSPSERCNAFDGIWPLFEEAILWRCILIRRLRDASEADWIVATATDRKKHWPVRRAAVLAATSLPFDVALQKIYGPILAERSSLSADKTGFLLFHAVISSFVGKEGRALLSQFFLSKKAFVTFSTRFSKRVQGNLSTMRVAVRRDGRFLAV